MEHVIGRGGSDKGGQGHHVSSWSAEVAAGGGGGGLEADLEQLWQQQEEQHCRDKQGLDGTTRGREQTMHWCGGRGGGEGGSWWLR